MWGSRARAAFYPHTMSMPPEAPPRGPFLLATSHRRTTDVRRCSARREKASRSKNRSGKDYVEMPLARQRAASPGCLGPALGLAPSSSSPCSLGPRSFDCSSDLSELLRAALRRLKFKKPDIQLIAELDWRRTCAERTRGAGGARCGCTSSRRSGERGGGGGTRRGWRCCGGCGRGPRPGRAGWGGTDGGARFASFLPCKLFRA